MKNLNISFFDTCEYFLGYYRKLNVYDGDVEEYTQGALKDPLFFIEQQIKYDAKYNSRS